MDDTPRRLDDIERVPHRTADDAVGRSGELTRNYAESLTAGVPNTNPGAAAVDRAVEPHHHDRTEPSDDRRTHEIRREIEQTRDEMSETIEALQEKLRPGHIAAEAAAQIKQTTAEKVKNMTQTAGRATENMVSQTKNTAADFVDDVR